MIGRTCSIMRLPVLRIARLRTVIVALAGRLPFGWPSSHRARCTSVETKRWGSGRVRRFQVAREAAGARREEISHPADETSAEAT